MKTPPPPGPALPDITRASSAAHSPGNTGNSPAAGIASAHIPEALNMTVEDRAAVRVLLGFRHQATHAQPITDVPVSLQPIPQPAPPAAVTHKTSENFLRRLLNKESSENQTSENFLSRLLNEESSENHQQGNPRTPPSSPASPRAAKRPRIGTNASPGEATSVPLYFETQGKGTLTCLQHAFNNAWQVDALRLDEGEALVGHGMDIGRICGPAGLGDRQMMRLELDKDQLDALKPLLLGEVDRMVIYRGTVTLDEEVQGHYIALLRQNGQWYLLDSLAEEPVEKNVAEFLDQCLVGGTTLVAAVPLQASDRIRTVVDKLSQGAFPYACRLLGQLYGKQPIEELADHLHAQASPDTTLSASKLAAYLTSRGHDASHQVLPAVGRDGQALENMLNNQLPQHAHGLLWMRTAPYLIAVRRHNDGWQTLAQNLGSNEAAFVSATPVALWSELQAHFDELHDTASDVRKNEIEFDRSRVEFIGLDNAFSAPWPEAVSVERLSQGPGQVSDFENGEIRLVKGREPYYAVMEFDNKGKLRCAAVPIEKTGYKRNYAKAKKDAEEVKLQIQKGIFDFAAHREYLWKKNDRPYSAAPGLNYDRGWKINVNYPQLNKLLDNVSIGKKVVVLPVHKNAQDDDLNKAIIAAQDLAESYWGRMMTGQLTAEQFRSELLTKGIIKPPAEFRSGIQHILWNSKDKCWSVSYLIKSDDGKSEKQKMAYFYARPVDKESVEKALLEAKKFAQGRTLGVIRKNQRSKK